MTRETEAEPDQALDEDALHFRLSYSDPPDPQEVAITRFVVGEQDDETAPLVSRAYFPPGYVVGPHTHETDYAEIVVQGSQRVGREWFHAGDVRVAIRGTVYGPLEAGPEGATVLVIFRDGRRTMRPPRAGLGVWVEPSGAERSYVVRREIDGLDPAGRGSR